VAKLQELIVDREIADFAGDQLIHEGVADQLVDQVCSFPKPLNAAGGSSSA
jgi:hypothetical protein